MESSRALISPVLTLKYKEKSISLVPPRSLFQLKYNLNKILGTRLPPSYLILIHEKSEIDSHIYENLITRPSAELTIIERENEPFKLVYTTATHIILYNLQDKSPEKLEIPHIHWSSVPFSLPNKHLLMITGEFNYEIIIGAELIITIKPQMLFPRYYFASTIINEFIYVIGGVSIEGYTNICERYNTLNDQWEYIHSHKGPGKSGMSATSWGNLKIFLFGGFDGMNYSATIEVYDVDIGTWKILPVTLPSSNYYMNVFEVDRGIMIVGGKNNRDCLFFDIANMTIKFECSVPQVVECSKFLQQNKKIANFVYFINLEGSVMQYDMIQKKIEVYFDHKKLTSA